MAIKTYPVIGTLLHDGKTYEQGETVELDEDQAKPLIAWRVLAEPEAAAGDKKKAKPAP